VRKGSWRAPTSWDEMHRRACGRRHYNSVRTFRATLRRGQVLRLLFRWGFAHGVQVRIARTLGCSEATLSRDMAVILPLFREIVPDGPLVPRYWYQER
jgi:hypothetical protein